MTIQANGVLSIKAAAITIEATGSLDLKASVDAHRSRRPGEHQLSVMDSPLHVSAT